MIGPDNAFMVYAMANGFFAGLSLEGGVLTQDNSANEKFYGIDGVSAVSSFLKEAFWRMFPVDIRD
ncbi:MAG: YSC84-related protein [Candidatus Scalindua sp.]